MRSAGIGREAAGSAWQFTALDHPVHQPVGHRFGACEVAAALSDAVGWMAAVGAAWDERLATPAQAFER